MLYQGIANSSHADDCLEIAGAASSQVLRPTLMYSSGGWKTRQRGAVRASKAAGMAARRPSRFASQATASASSAPSGLQDDADLREPDSQASGSVQQASLHRPAMQLQPAKPQVLQIIAPCSVQSFVPFCAFQMHFCPWWPMQGLCAMLQPVWHVNVSHACCFLHSMRCITCIVSGRHAVDRTLIALLIMKASACLA